MPRLPRHHVLLLALCALLLRGAIAPGWMPSAAGGVLALCTADGLVQLAPAPGDLLPDAAAGHDGQGSHSGPCSFAATGALGIAASPALPGSFALATAAEIRYTVPLLAPRPAGNALARAPPPGLNRA